MAFQRSEEQKKDLKMKIYTVVFFALVTGIIVYFGPGLHRFQVEPAMRDKDPDALLKAAGILWWSGRREAAVKVYEDFYLMFRGNERQDEALYDLAVADYGEDNDYAFYAPHVWYTRYWDPENEVFREPDIKPVNPEGAPHPRLPEAILRLGQYWEDKKERVQYVHLYKVIDQCFPNADPEVKKKAKNGLLRAASRSL